MRLTLLCRFYAPRKVRKKLYLAQSQTELCERLAAKGHEIRVIARRIKGTKRVSKKNHIEIYRVGFIEKPILGLVTSTLTTIYRLFKLELRKRSDVVLCWDWSVAFSALLVGKIFKIPVVCSTRAGSLANFYRGQRFKAIIYKFLESFVLNNVDFILHSSKWVKSSFKFKIKTPSLILHHGVNTQLFHPNVRPMIKSKAPIIGYLGRHTKDKGLDTLLKACEILKRDGFKFKLITGGYGPELEKLKKNARKSNLNASFYGYIPEEKKIRFLKSFDVFVLPSLIEGFSNVLLEAMAVGVAVVASDVGGASEIIDNGSNGFTFKAGNYEQLAFCLKKLLKDAKLRQKVGKNAAKFIRERYDWEIFTEKWETILKNIIQKVKK